MKTEPASINQDTIRDFENTGDAGIEVEAPTRADLFACAAIGLARILVAPDAIEPRDTLTLEFFGTSDKDLLHEALSDALDLFLSDGFIWRDATAEERSDGIVLKLTGEQFSRFRHTALTELKAVAHDQLKVERVDGEWKARIVFDL